MGHNGIFQFTASYEADHTGEELTWQKESFNSQPQTRLTAAGQVIYRGDAACQCTASYEADRFYMKEYLDSDLFQFTASYEADLVALTSVFVSTIFQFTASYEADRHRSL